MQIMKLREAIRPHAPKVLVYGDSGIGKTSLIGSLPGRVLIVSAESGLLSLSFAAGDDRFDVVEIVTVDDLINVHKHLTGKGHGYDWVCIDSISEIAEVVLTAEKKKVSDPRQAYGAVIERVTAAMRAFRDLPIGVYFSAKLAKVKQQAAEACCSSSASRRPWRAGSRARRVPGRWTASRPARTCASWSRVV